MERFVAGPFLLAKESGSISDEGQSHTIVGPLGLFLMGALAGGISLLVYSRRLTPFRGFYQLG
jgi:hypothetical protein